MRARAAAVRSSAFASIDRRMTPRRIGYSTNIASSAVRMFTAAATYSTASQLPVASRSTLPSGTSSAAVPFAVYSSP